MRVLILADNIATGLSVVRIATASGMDAVAVTDSDIFERSFHAGGAPQVVLLDLQPGETGGIGQLRRLAHWKYTGILALMSGFDTGELSKAQSLGRSLGLKVDAVLEKPLRLPEIGRLFEHLSRRDRRLPSERLREAIANNEMSLDFQPVVSRGSNELTKLEALIRWNNPLSGRIAPATFLPTAESCTRTIEALTDWVLGAAVEAYQVLAENGLSVPLAVNISTRNLHDLTFPDRIEQRLRAGGMPARHLCLEIRESAVFEDPERTSGILSRMRVKGIPLSIDDFGTGFSFLTLLRCRRFTEIKIDQSFVCDMTTSRDSRVIVKSIIDLAADMEIGCVAEGVETVETADLLEQLGARELQGYLIARPMPVESIPAWLAQWTNRRSLAPYQETAAGAIRG